MKFFSFKRAFAVLGVCILQTAAALGAVNITTQPVDVLAAADGSKITLSVQATGVGPLSYTWKKGVPGNITFSKTSSSNQFIIPAAKTTDAGTWFVTVEETNGGANATSNVVNVTVTVRPKISNFTLTPAVATESDPALDDVTFNVTLDPVIGDAPFTYQLQKKSGTAFIDVGVPVVDSPNRANQFNLNGVTLATAGTYRVVVTNAANINNVKVLVISKELILKVNSRPIITSQPASTPIVIFGATGVLKVVVGGYAPFAYRWLKRPTGGGPNDFVVIPKATAASLTIKGTDNPAAGVAEGPGEYKVQIVNKYSPLYPTDPKATDPFTVATITESTVSTVTVIRKPKILTQPLKQTISLMAGPNPVTFTVVMDLAGNPGVLHYKWYKDNKLIVGAPDSNTYTIPSVAWADRGSYKVEISNQVGKVTSVAAVLTVVSPPIILTQSPAETYGSLKGTAKLFVTTTGTTPILYEWRFLKVADAAGKTPVEIEALLAANAPPPPLPSAAPPPPAPPVTIVGKAASLSLAGLDPAKHHGYYRCFVTNAPKALPGGAAQSVVMYVQVDEAPKITKQTEVLPYNAGILKGTPNIPVAAGNKLHLKVTATGTNLPADAGNFKMNVLKFQWLRNNVIIPGATSSEYIVAQVTANETGKYTCEISNLCGKVISTALSIVASGPPVVTVQPGDGAGIEESRVETVALTANGAGTLKYEWQKLSGIDWSAVSGQITNKLVLGSAKVSDSGTYRCRVYNILGTTTLGEVFSNTVTVTVSAIPAATLGPVPGLSTVTFFPRVARSLDKVRIFGQNLQYTNAVNFGPGVTASFVIESNNSILVTVPLAAPTTSTPITVITKGKLVTSVGGGSTTTGPGFTRTTGYANNIANATILTLTSGTVALEGDDTSHALADPYGRAYYLLYVKKRSSVYITLSGGQTIAGYVEMDLNVYRNVPPFFPNPNNPPPLVGPDGVTYFPGVLAPDSVFLSNPQHRSFLYGPDQVTFDTLVDDVWVLIEAFSGFAAPLPGYVNFGPFSVTATVLPLPPSASAVPDNVTLVNGGKWESSDRSAPVVTSETEANGGQTITFGGDTATASSQPVSLWQPEAGSNVTGGTVVSSFSMGLEPGNDNGDDQFAWQVSSADGSPLMALWINAADGSLRVVQPDGTVTTSAQHITPGGGTHRFEIAVNLDDDTWITLMDGVPVTAPVKIAPDASFGDISAVWDLGQDQTASGASITFSNFRVEGLVAP